MHSAPQQLCSVRARDRRRRGSTMILVLGAMIALIAISALAIDVGIIWAARSQLQNAADAGALAGAASMIDPTGPTVTLDAAIDASVELAAQNIGGSNMSLELARENVTIGNWRVNLICTTCRKKRLGWYFGTPMVGRFTRKWCNIFVR